MLQRLRRAMLRPERGRLSGVIEVDEAYVGGVEEGRRGGRWRDSAKSIIVGTVEVRGRGSGRVRLAVVGDLSAASLAAFVGAWAEPGGTVLTGGWQGYAPLRERFDHRPSTVGDPRNAEERVQAAPAGPSDLLEPEDLAEGDPPRGEREAPAALRRRVRVPLQPPAHAGGGVPVPARPLDAARTDYPQDVVCG